MHGISGMQFTQSIVSGLLLGGTFVALAIGFSLILGIARVVNLAHPVFALVGAYITFWLLEIFGWNPLFSLVVVIPVLFMFGVGLERTVIRQTAKRTRDITSASLVLTFGITIIVENLLLVICKATPRLVTTSISGRSLFFSDVAVPLNILVGFAISVVTVAAIYFLLHRTFFGKAARAVWQDREGATLMGINVNAITAVTYGISFAAAGIAGTSMSLIYSIEPSTHWAWINFVFAIVIVGGVGSIKGTAMAGLLVGLIIGIANALIPLTWINLVLFGIIIILLLIRPTGLVRQ
jgi:branched-chain amino acid transport system permease protein